MLNHLLSYVAVLLLLVSCGSSNWDPDSNTTTMLISEESCTPSTLNENCLIVEGNDGLTPFEAFIQNASKEINMTMYEFEQNTTLFENGFVSLLEEAAVKGVQVNILYSNGTNSYLNYESNWCAERQNVSCRMTSEQFYVTHQKSLLIDGNITIIMSLNGVQTQYTNYFGTTRDFAFVSNKSEDVQTMSNQFNTDWLNAENNTSNFPQVVSGSKIFFSPSAENNFSYNSQNTLYNTISSATKSVYIYAEEFTNTDAYAPQNDIVVLLNTLVNKGVEVKIINAFCEAGVYATKLDDAIEVLTVPNNYPLYNHTKSAIVDGKTATVMSVNYTYASINKNREAGIVVEDEALVSTIAQTFENDFTAISNFIDANASLAPYKGCYNPSSMKVELYK